MEGLWGEGEDGLKEKKMCRVVEVVIVVDVVEEGGGERERVGERERCEVVFGL